MRSEYHPHENITNKNENGFKHYWMHNALLSVNFLSTKLVPLVMTGRVIFLDLGRRGRGWAVQKAKGIWRGAHICSFHCSPLIISGFLELLCCGRGCSTKLHLSNVNKNTWPLSTAFLAPHLPGPGSCMLT